MYVYSRCTCSDANIFEGRSKAVNGALPQSHFFHFSKPCFVHDVEARHQGVFHSRLFVRGAKGL